MLIEVGFGTKKQSAQVPDGNVIGVLAPNKISSEKTCEEAVRFALDNPIGTERLGKIVNPGEKIAIITSDITRPMPTRKVLPYVLKELYEAGVSPEDITLVFALGSHRGHTEEEQRYLAGDEAYETITCIDSDPDDVIRLGMTSKGSPIDITRSVVEADRRICLGNIEYHYFAGYSGGIKAVFPGCSTPDAIQANHSIMIDDRAFAGNLEDNPLRRDLDEAIELSSVDFILNVVLNEKKDVVYAVAGDIKKAHREGCAFLDQLYKVSIPQKADIVIVSQGGAPKDLNLYQTQKALDNSKHAVKDGGTIILVGSCHEGFGNATFENWFTSADSPDALIRRIREDFKLGGHKAAAIAMVQKKAGIKLVSDMPDNTVRSIFMEPYGDLQSAVDDAFSKHGPDASVIVMPYGGSTLPVL